MPGGPPGRDAALVTCTFLEADDPAGACERLMLEALADLKARGFPAVEAFALRYPEEVRGARPLRRPPHALRPRLPRAPRLLPRCAPRARSPCCASRSAVSLPPMIRIALDISAGSDLYRKLNSFCADCLVGEQKSPSTAALFLECRSIPPAYPPLKIPMATFLLSYVPIGVLCYKCRVSLIRVSPSLMVVAMALGAGDSGRCHWWLYIQCMRRAA